MPPERFIESKDVLDANEDKKRSPLPSYYYTTFIVIISLILGFEIANELNLNFYLPSYLNKSDLRLDQDTIALMMASVGGAYALGRLFNILIAIKIDVLIILYFNLSLIVIGNLILSFATSSQSAWIAILLLGFGYSSTFPALFAFIEQRITITNTLNSFLVFVTSSVFTISSLIIGNSIDENPSLFQYLNSVSTILFVALFIVLHSIDFWKKVLLKKLVFN